MCVCEGVIIIAGYLHNVLLCPYLHNGIFIFILLGCRFVTLQASTGSVTKPAMLPFMSNDLNDVASVALSVCNGSTLTDTIKNLTKVMVVANEENTEALLVDAMFVGGEVRTSN